MSTEHKPQREPEVIHLTVGDIELSEDLVRKADYDELIEQYEELRMERDHFKRRCRTLRTIMGERQEQLEAVRSERDDELFVERRRADAAEAFIEHQGMSYRYAEWTSNPASEPNA